MSIPMKYDLGSLDVHWEKLQILTIYFVSLVRPPIGFPFSFVRFLLCRSIGIQILSFHKSYSFQGFFPVAFRENRKTYLCFTILREPQETRGILTFQSLQWGWEDQFKESWWCEFIMTVFKEFFALFIVKN